MEKRENFMVIKAIHLEKKEENIIICEYCPTFIDKELCLIYFMRMVQVLFISVIGVIFSRTIKSMDCEDFTSYI